MEMIIEQMPVQDIAFIRNVGPYGIDNYVTMEKIKKFAKENNLFDENAIIFGISKDNPAVTKPEECRYDECIVVSKDFATSESNIQQGINQGGKYAVCIIDHTAEAVQKAWSEIFNEVSSNGYTIDFSRDIIERYAVKMVNDHKCEICVPII